MGNFPQKSGLASFPPWFSYEGFWSKLFYEPDTLLVLQPTASQHWRISSDRFHKQLNITNIGWSPAKSAHWINSQYYQGWPIVFFSLCYAVKHHIHRVRKKVYSIVCVTFQFSSGPYGISGVARPTYNLHQRLNIMDSKPTNRKLFCVNQQHPSIHQLIQHIQIYTIVMFPHQGSNNCMTSCAPTPWGVRDTIAIITKTNLGHGLGIWLLLWFSPTHNKLPTPCSHLAALHLTFSSRRILVRVIVEECKATVLPRRIIRVWIY